MESIAAASVRSVGGERDLTLDLEHHRWVAQNAQAVSREDLTAAHKVLLGHIEQLAAGSRAPRSAARARHVGELIAALMNYPKEARVMVELRGRRTYAGRCGSYRGYPYEVAISPEGHHPSTVDELVKGLKSLIRTGVSGHDGSKYPVRRLTAVWVSAPEEASRQHVDRVYLDGTTVVITTVPEEPWTPAGTNAGTPEASTSSA